MDQDEEAWVREKNKILRFEATVCASLFGGVVFMALVFFGENLLFRISPYSPNGSASVVVALFIGGVVSWRIASRAFKNVDFFKGCE